MGRVKTLRTRACKDSIEDLRERVMTDYRRGNISRRRMELLVAILDTFERESNMPARFLEKEVYQEAAFDKGVLTPKRGRGKVGNEQAGLPKGGE